MTDIVERLNKLLNDINMYDHYRPEIRKAAKEIKRLRAALVGIEELVDGYADADDGQPNLAMRVQTTVHIALRRES
jgi:hypothetical protein